ncbi:DNA mismatch endonuclease Vsr [Mesorhizobium sp. M7A.F.Ca.US.006.01.1.1]|uniref:very short patch repair endonuclease n=1 Tax=Mesorhizobium sp. M7A.F.Ca.US.006.01.1.1 TaxID=2496707 RepID=UPI000FCCD3AA|nr:very short patch repair endonuclease [Mesorhizobium sp. M7A.F.Ca.US.006.01.1.1]RUZ79411.1 DNA mismatch endonuclease Vsr [Mesorhizobium sp. M7A.F.Ca.US.006.01.1.1]
MDDVPDARRRLMANVRSADTKPEMVVRRIAHALGYRYRLHIRSLPGSPDLVFPGKRKVIFVHGCFWHRHHGCSRTTFPKTREDYWNAKFSANIARDAAQATALLGLGWSVLTIWECEIRDLLALRQRISSFLSNDAASAPFPN